MSPSAVLNHTYTVRFPSLYASKYLAQECKTVILLLVIHCCKETMVIRGRRKLFDLSLERAFQRENLRKKLLLEIPENTVELRFVNEMICMLSDCQFHKCCRYKCKTRNIQNVLWWNHCCPFYQGSNLKIPGQLPLTYQGLKRVE